MPQPDVRVVQESLSREVPEFGLSRDAMTLLGTLMVLLASIGLSAALAAGLTWLLSIAIEVDVEDETLMAVAVAAPFVGLLIGYATRNSVSSVGSDIANRAATRDTSSWGLGYTQDDQSAETGFGCLLFLVQALGGGIYSSLSQLGQFFRGGHEAERALAVSIIYHLLENGPTPTAELARSLEEQGVSRDLIAKTLRILRKASVLEPSPERVSISPSKRHSFYSHG